MPDLPETLAQLGRLLGDPVSDARSLSGGCVADVRVLTLESGRVVAKIGGPDLDIEGRMLDHLGERSDLPVPRVLHAEADLLVMEHIEARAARAGAGTSPTCWRRCTDHEPRRSVRLCLADSDRPDPTRNGWASDWGGFYRDARVLPLIDEASRGKPGAGLERRLRSYAERVGDDLDHARRHRSFTAMSGAKRARER